MEKKIRNKTDRVLGEVRMVRGNLIKELRDEGVTVLEPDWPRYLLIDAFGVPTFAHLKRSGERLSDRQMRTMNVLEKLGFNTLLVYQKQPRKLPEEMFKIGKRERISIREKVEPFDPIRHREEIKDTKEADERMDEEYNEIMASLNIAARKRDTSPPLTSTIEALPEEAPNLEKKVRVIQGDDEPTVKDGER